MIKDNLDNLRATIAYGLALEAAGLHANVRIEFGRHPYHGDDPETVVQIVGIEVSGERRQKVLRAINGLRNLQVEMPVKGVEDGGNVHARGDTADGVRVVLCTDVETWEALTAPIEVGDAERAMAAEVVKAIETAEVSE